MEHYLIRLGTVAFEILIVETFFRRLLRLRIAAEPPALVVEYVSQEH